MEAKKRTRGRPPGTRFSRKLPVYDTDEGMALLQALAQHRGISAAAVVRQLVREESRRLGPSVIPEPIRGVPAPGEDTPEGAG